VLAVIAVEFRVPATPREGNAARGPAFVSEKNVNSVLQRACGNCHSNETKWPWYGRSGPAAWFIRRDVRKAKERLNFSEQPWLDANEREEIFDAVSDGSMPPRVYTMLHPEARLSARDVATLEAWAGHF